MEASLNTRAGAAAEAATSGLTALPLPLQHRIILALPVDARGRAACVARGWRNVLADPALWTRLNLSGSSGISPGVARRLDRLLLGAAGRARGQLRELDITSRIFPPPSLLEVVTANAGSLRVLRLDEALFGEMHYDGIRKPTVDALLGAAPLLEVLEADFRCTLEDATRLLNLAPGPLRFRKVKALFPYNFGGVNAFGMHGDLERISPFAAALADRALQPALSGFHFWRAWFEPEALDALVDAVLVRRLPEVSFYRCLLPDTLPTAVARLLAGNSLTTLEFSSTAEGEFQGEENPLLDADGAALVAGALRANTTLTTLEFHYGGLCLDIDAAVAVLGALVGHASLRKLVLSDERNENPDAVGVALAAIVAADAPALQELSIDNNDLSDEALTPLVDALRGNRHLRRLNVSHNDLSEAFTRERLLPAVRANTGLRYLVCYDNSDDEVEELVNRRSQVA